ncbi:MAG TPA: hypothetical protein VJ201_04440, partial [Candidatus Babeliales bacterium]|nr:hypothetical protein [Candidatus Babeliales bacterium]
MSLTVPNKDFKVIYYDRYSGISISKALTLGGIDYLFGGELHNTLLEFFKKGVAEKWSVFVVNTPTNTYSWIPTKLDTPLFDKEFKPVPILDVLAGHEAAIKLIVDGLTTSSSASNSNLDVIVVYNSADTTIYHAITFAGFLAVGSDTWYNTEENWKEQMKNFKNEIFII